MSFMSVDNRWWPLLRFGRRRRRTGAALRMQSSHQQSHCTQVLYETKREREEKRR